MRALLVSAGADEVGLLGDLVRRCGYELTPVDSAEAAWASLEARDYSMVLLDADGPRDEAADLCRRIRALPGAGHTLIVVVNGRQHRERIAPLLAAGADDYLTDLADVERLELRLMAAGHGPRPDPGQDAALAQIAQDVARPKTSTAPWTGCHEQLLALYEATADGVLIADTKTKALLHANPAICRMLGYSEDEIRRMSVSDIHPPEQLPAVLRHFETIGSEGVTQTKSIPFRRKDGSVFCASVAGTAVEWEGRSYSVGVFRDVTEQVESLRQLHESEDRYRLIASHVSDMIWTASMAGLESLADRLGRDDLAAIAEDMIRGWRFTYVSPSVERLLGYSVEEMMARTLVDLLPPEDFADATAALADELASERQTPGQDRRRTLQVRHLAKDGSLRDVEVTTAFQRDADGRLSGLLGITRDITERKRSERAVRESEAKLRSLLENMPDFVITVDRDATIRYVNHGQSNVPTEGLLGSIGYEYLVPEHREACREATRLALQTGQPQRVEAMDVFGVWWSCRLVPLAHEGEVEGVMVICTDVTEQKEAAKAVAKEQRLLRQLLDLHERDRRLIAYEVHDGFAQQVTGALLNLQSFARHPDPSGSEARPLLDAAMGLMSEAIAESRRLISGLRPPVLDEFGIVAAVGYLVCECQQHHGLEVEFLHDVQFDRLAPPLESGIFRIVQESLGNVQRHGRSAKARVELTQRGERIHLRVRDWGVGFDPQRVEENHFGLQGICERARLMGGDVAIDSSPDRGTELSVELPLIAALGCPTIEGAESRE